MKLHGIGRGGSFFHSHKTSKKIMYLKGSINVVEKQKLKGIFVQTP